MPSLLSTLISAASLLVLPCSSFLGGVAVVVAADDRGDDGAFGGGDYFNDKEPNFVVPTLTEDNLVEFTTGKSVMIHFWVPDCLACQVLTGTWLKLAQDWQGSESGLVAQVNCEADESSAELCEDYGVDKTFPTILFGDALSPEVYDESLWEQEYNQQSDNDDNDWLSYNALSALAQKHLSQPPCNVANLQESCPPDVQAVLQDLLAKSRDELEDLEVDIDAELAEVELAYDDALARINEEFQQALATYNDKMQRIRKERHYKWVQMVLAETDPELNVGDNDGEQQQQQREEL